MLIIARHGQSLYNRANLFTGIVDSKLSKKGIKEAEKLGHEFKDKNIRFDYIFSSPMSRAYTTAEIILEQTFSVCDIITHRRLAERDHGDFTGRDKAELLLEYGDKKFRSFKRSLDIPYPNCESMDNVITRVTSWLVEQLLPLHDKGHVLVISHTDTIKALNLLLELITEREAIDFAIPTGEAIYVPWITVKNNILV